MKEPQNLSRNMFSMHGSRVFTNIFMKWGQNHKIPKIIIPVIIKIIIMVNLSLINDNNVIKSMTSNSKHRTNSKYGERRKRKI